MTVGKHQRKDPPYADRTHRRRSDHSRARLAGICDRGIYIDVDTSAARFTGRPIYVTSIGSTGGSQWALLGSSAVYDTTANKFRVYVQWRDQSPLSPGTAAQYGWFINWIGYDNP